MTVLTLLTDFGTRDGYVGSMKGVILGISPKVMVLDIAHDLPQGDIETGAWVLSQYWDLYPAGTVHVAVIDPGVGSGRRAIALEAEGRFVVAPDNGLITRVLARSATGSIVEIREPAYQHSKVSPTFHGRDVFAPAGAHLAAGVALSELGPAVRDPELLDLEEPERETATVRGRIVHVDRFGNLISDIPASWIGEGWRFTVEGVDVGPIRATYSAVEPKGLVVVEGSLGTIEVAVRDGSAADRLKLERGARLVGKEGPAD